VYTFTKLDDILVGPIFFYSIKIFTAHGIKTSTHENGLSIGLSLK